MRRESKFRGLRVVEGALRRDECHIVSTLNFVHLSPMSLAAFDRSLWKRHSHTNFVSHKHAFQVNNTALSDSQPSDHGIVVLVKLDTVSKVALVISESFSVRRIQFQSPLSFLATRMNFNSVSRFWMSKSCVATGLE
jgi:hypothetical protein